MGNTAARLTNKMRQHQLGSFKVRDYAVQQRRNHGNIAGLSAVHLLCFQPDRDYFTSGCINGNSDGSSTTTPRPRTSMIVDPDPMSIAIESETRLRKAPSPVNAAVLFINDI